MFKPLLKKFSTNAISRKFSTNAISKGFSTNAISKGFSTNAISRKFSTNAIILNVEICTVKFGAQPDKKRIAFVLPYDFVKKIQHDATIRISPITNVFGYFNILSEEDGIHVHNDRYYWHP
jgi:hypothetical protein